MRRVSHHTATRDPARLLTDHIIAFVAINARNFLTFGLTYFVNDWLEKDGVLAVFNVLGSIFVVVNLLTVPLWIYGKRIRGFIARNKFLDKFMHED